MLHNKSSILFSTSWKSQ